MESIECFRNGAKTGIKLKGVKSDARQPIHTILCVDTSGSMDYDNKLANVKKSLTTFTKCMADGDAVTIVTFDTVATTLLKRTELTDSNRILIENAIKSIKTDGSTNLSGGLLTCFQAIETVPGRKQGILMLTDGHANVGETSPVRILQMCDKFFQDHADVTMTVVGYGLDHNADLLKSLAISGKGSYNLVANLEDVAIVFGTVLGSLLSVVCQIISVDIAGSATMITSQKMLGGTIQIGDLHSEESIPILMEGEVTGVRVNWFDIRSGESKRQDILIQLTDDLGMPEWMDLAIWQQRVSRLIERTAHRETGLLADVEAEIVALTTSYYAGHALIQRLILELKEVADLLKAPQRSHEADVSMLQRSAVLGLGRGFTSPAGRMRRAAAAAASDDEGEDPMAPMNAQMSQMSQLVRSITQGGAP